jgi:AcrR family transcriptional regulator
LIRLQADQTECNPTDQIIFIGETPVLLLPNLEEMRRSHILDSAMKALAESGSNSITMEDIARFTGLSKGGLAYYYQSENDL